MWRKNDIALIRSYSSRFIYGLYTAHLVVILHQLDDHPDVVAVVLDGDDPHDVGSVLRVRVGAVLVGQH